MQIQNIRVKVNEEYHGLYKDLTQANKIRKPVLDGHGRLFTFCALLAYKRGFNNLEPLKKGKPLFWSHNLNNHETTLLYSIAILNEGQTKFDYLSSPEDVIHISENFANEGMKVLIEEILTPYVKEDKEGIMYLDYSDTSFLEKDLLSLIQIEMVKTPFD